MKEGEFKPVSRTAADGGVSRDAKEERARREDKKKLEDLMKKDAPGAVMQLNKLGDLFPSRKRSKLVLPPPQVPRVSMHSYRTHVYDVCICIVSVCRCICIYVYVCMCMYVCMYACIYVYVCMYVCIFISVCILFIS